MCGVDALAELQDGGGCTPALLVPEATHPRLAKYIARVSRQAGQGGSSRTALKEGSTDRPLDGLLACLVSGAALP